MTARITPLRRNLRWRAGTCAVVAAGIIVLFGGWDEWIQGRTPGRFSDPVDWAADAFGGCSACGLWWVCRKRYREAELP